MKEMYQQAVAGSDRVTKINAAEEIQHSTHTRSIKERFERGEPIAAADDETDSKPKPEKADEEVIAAGNELDCQLIRGSNSRARAAAQNYETEPSKMYFATAKLRSVENVLQSYARARGMENYYVLRSSGSIL